jgi:thiol-disulfide isomerase/thioredoxin
VKLRTVACWVLGCLSAFSTASCLADPKVGEPAPDVALGVTTAGETARTSAYPGKVVVLSFWASWCSPCRAELPVLEGIQREGKGAIQVIAVNIERPDVFKKAVKALGTLKLELVNDRNDWSQRAYGVHAIPHMVIIGKDGRILDIHKGYGDKLLDGLVDEINHALAADAAAKDGRT